jgi:4-diphosphocytidyl-2-C-methyl-D-erythritol kinase
MTLIVEPAPAKINLALHVRARRPDGYHDLETLFAFAADGDRVTVEIAQTDSFTIVGPFAAALLTPGGSDVHETHAHAAARETSGNAPWHGNLVTAAADAFGAMFAIDARHAIILDKHLPIASGIGGGSADAAAALRALARLHGIAATDPRLHEIAARLGADVPACLVSRTTLGVGKGEVLVELAGLAGTPLLLVNPGVAVSTATVFGAWDGLDRGPIPEGDLLSRARASRNDLEPPAVVLAPVIAEVRSLLDTADGVVLARMSGSGATCFAVFDTIAARDVAAAGAAARGWWTLATTLV